MSEEIIAAHARVIKAARKRWPAAVRFWVDEERQTWFQNDALTSTTLCKLWVLPKDMMNGRHGVIALLNAATLTGLLQQIQEWGAKGESCSG